MAAERRSWLDQVLGRQPTNIPACSCGGRARGAHLDRHSTWLHNSLRGAAALAGAVLVADLVHARARVLGRPRDALGAALQRAEHGPERRARAARHGRRHHRRRGHRARGRDEHDAAVGPPAARDPRDGRGARGDLVRGGPGRVHRHRPHPLRPAGAGGWRPGSSGSRTSRWAAPSAWSSGCCCGRAARRRCSARRSPRRTWMRRPTSPMRSTERTPSTAEAVRAASASRRLDDTFRGYLAERGSKPVPLEDVDPARERRRRDPAARRRGGRPLAPRRRRPAPRPRTWSAARST